MTDGRENVTDRVADRFETDTGDSQSDKKTQKAKNAQHSEKDLPNVKEAWSAKSVYLPDDIKQDLEKAYKQLDLELDDDLEQFEKTRHFYPLLIMEGIERMESKESEELIERLGEVDPDFQDYLSK